MVIIMKNTVKKNLCTFIAVIVAASATIVLPDAPTMEHRRLRQAVRALQVKQAMMHLLYHRQNNRQRREKQLKLMILHGMWIKELLTVKICSFRLYKQFKIYSYGF